MNKRKIWKIFDSTVKALFSEPKYLVQFLQAVLPPALVKSTDWNAVSVLSGMLPDSSGMSERPIYADLIVQLPQVRRYAGEDMQYHRDQIGRCAWIREAIV